MTSMLRRWAGAILVVEAAQFLVALLVGSSIASGYRVRDEPFSDLGTIPATALLFNGSLVAVGVLNIVAGALWYRLERAPITGLIFLMAGVGAAGAGLVTLDNNEGVHDLFALLGFLGFNLMAVVVGLSLRGPLRIMSLIAGATGLAFLGLLIAGLSGVAWAFAGLGLGGVERLVVYPPSLWMIVLGGYLLGLANQGPSAGT